MPRKVTCSAKVGVLTNLSSTPSSLENCMAWARKILRLQKPVPCVDLSSFAAYAAPLNRLDEMPMVKTAAPDVLSRRRRSKSIDSRSGRCVHPILSHIALHSFSFKRWLRNQTAALAASQAFDHGAPAGHSHRRRIDTQPQGVA